MLTVRPSNRVRVLDVLGGQFVRATSTILDVVCHTAGVSFRLWALKGDKVGSETRETHHIRYYFPQEYALFLEQAGFAMQSFSAFPSLDAPLTDQAWNPFVVATAQ